jgi:MarR family 2-MHQ and catechol resistance regulon transcriptional repressor
MINPIDKELHRTLRTLILSLSASDKFIFAKHKLRTARFYILHHLYHEPGLTLGQLSEMTLLYNASASRIVYAMEKDGLVQRENDENDRRLFTLSLTENGRFFYETVNADLEADIQQRFAGLDEETRTNLRNSAQQLQTLMQDHRQWQEESSDQIT